MASIKIDEGGAERSMTGDPTPEEMLQGEMTFRRQWAQRIREYFDNYHEHSGYGECGACGAIAAANWMDPDRTEDGPLDETYSRWKGRQP